MRYMSCTIPLCFKSWLPSPVMSIPHPYKGVLQHRHQHSQESLRSITIPCYTTTTTQRLHSPFWGESYLPAVTSFLFPCLSQHASSSGSKGRPDATASMQGETKGTKTHFTVHQDKLPALLHLACLSWMPAAMLGTFWSPWGFSSLLNEVEGKEYFSPT